MKSIDFPSRVSLVIPDLGSVPADVLGVRDRVVTVSVPSWFEPFMPQSEGPGVALEFAGPTGLTQVTGVGTRDQDEATVLHFLADASRQIQRRTEVRVELAADVLITPGEPWAPRLRARTVNLSGSGMLIAGAESLEVDQSVHVGIALPGGPTVDMLARVVRDRAREKALTTEVIFDEQHDQLIRYLFEIQRQALKRRLEL